MCIYTFVASNNVAQRYPLFAPGVTTSFVSLKTSKKYQKHYELHSVHGHITKCTVFAQLRVCKTHVLLIVMNSKVGLFMKWWRISNTDCRTLDIILDRNRKPKIRTPSLGSRLALQFPAGLPRWNTSAVVDQHAPRVARWPQSNSRLFLTSIRRRLRSILKATSRPFIWFGSQVLPCMAKLASVALHIPIVIILLCFSERYKIIEESSNDSQFLNDHKCNRLKDDNYNWSWWRWSSRNVGS
jgi:hypothetical protein